MEKSDAQNLYEIINDFIEQTHIPIMELLGVFEIIKIEQAQNFVKDDEDIE